MNLVFFLLTCLYISLMIYFTISPSHLSGSGGGSGKKARPLEFAWLASLVPIYLRSFFSSPAHVFSLFFFFLFLSSFSLFSSHFIAFFLTSALNIGQSPGLSDVIDWRFFKRKRIIMWPSIRLYIWISTLLSRAR